MIYVDVDMREFNAAVKESILTSSRVASRVITGAALHLATESEIQTKRANLQKMAHVLGQIGTKLRKQRKTGKFVAGKRIYGGVNTFAARIIRVKRKRNNLDPLTDAEMEKAVTRFIAARIRSVGFIASGWKWAIADLSRIVGYDDPRPRKKQTKPPKGKRMGQAIRFGRKSQPSVKIINTALDNDKGGAGALPVAEAGVYKAQPVVIADIKKHIKERLEKALKKHSAR